MCRPWYIEVASRQPKDVVIALDRSNHMTSTQLELGKKAASFVLATLSPKDRVRICTLLFTIYSLVCIALTTRYSC